MTSLLTGAEASTTKVEHPDAKASRLAAEKVYPPTQTVATQAPNAAVQTLRADESVQRSMYPPEKQYGKNAAAIRDLALAIKYTSTDAEVNALVPELAAIAVDVGMDRNDVESLASIVNQFQAKPPTAEERDSYKRLAMREARSKYGADFDRILADGQKLAKRDPRLAEILQKTGAGDHPQLIARFCELGQTARSRGRL